MEEKQVTRSFRVIKWIVQKVYFKWKVSGAELLPEEPCVLVGNHCQIHGPLACEFYTPIPRATWCAGQMMEWKEVPGYAFQDFWSQKPKWTHPFFKLASYLITPLAVCIFNNAYTIPVWRDTRIIQTFKKTISCLQDGRSVVIFPEYDAPCNNILYAFQDRFIDVAKYYYNKTGKELLFVPMYLAPSLRTMYFGEAVRFHADAPLKEERERICREMTERITDLARSLPRHRVTPYRNIPKRLYPYNTDQQGESL